MKPKWLLWLLTIGLCSIFVYSYRYNYLQPFDYQYARDLFDHSQWRIPITPRSIGDGLLYQIAGVDVFKTGNIFDINPEMPPLGKYLYGLSIGLFNNAYIINLFLFALAILFYLLISKEILKKMWQRWAALFVFLLQPLFFSQLNTTLLDLPHLVALFIHIYAFLKILKAKKPNLGYVLLAGLGLGFFISIKIGFLVAVILVIDLYLLLKIRKGSLILPILIMMTLTYLLVYLPYFFQNHTLVEFIKAQLWMFKFHTSSKININHFLLPISFFSGWYKGWNQDAEWTRSDHWSFSWPLIGIFFLFQFNRFAQKRSFNNPGARTYLFLLSIGFLFIYLFIPFWTRYLLLVLPLMIILVIQSLPRCATIWIGIVICLALSQLPWVLISPAQNTTTWVEKLWDEGLYQDFYSFLKFDKSYAPSRQRFWIDSLKFEQQLTASDREIEIRLSSPSRFESRVSATISLTYQTTLGPVKQTVPATFVRQQNRWFLKWKPELRLKKYSLDSQIQVNLIEAQGGQLLTADQKILSTYEPRPYFSVIPSLIKNEETLWKQLTKLTGFDRPYLETLYKVNTPPCLSAAIGYLKADLDIGILQKVKLDPGIKVTYKKTRSYNLLDYKDKISQIQILEAKYPELNPKIGGKILMTNNQETKVIKETVTVNGQDVQLSESII